MMTQIISNTIRIQGYTLHFLACGRGPAVILLQGFPVSADYWRPTLELLGRSGYRAIAVDTLGFGQSDKPDHAPYSLPFFANLYADLLDALNLEHATFVGHSFGGKLALSTAVLHPQRVSRLVLLDSDGFTSIPYFIRVPGPLGRVGELLLWLSSHPALIRAQMQLAFYDPTPHVTPGMVALGSDVLRLPKNRRVLMLMSRRYKDNDLLHSGLRARLGELRIPTLVIWGEHDRVFAPCYGEIASREIPCARLVTIPRCGHFPHIETPRVFHGLLLGFLAKDEHVPCISPGSRVPPRHLPQTCTAEAAAQ
jgi:pimeloyl-ACP methyl ester carboxylesterase